MKEMRGDSDSRDNESVILLVSDRVRVPRVSERVNVTDRDKEAEAVGDG